jgi:hypothetical protein
MESEKSYYSTAAFAVSMFSLFMPYVKISRTEFSNGFEAIGTYRYLTSVIGIDLAVLVGLSALIFGFYISIFSIGRLSQLLSSIGVACFVFVGFKVNFSSLGIGYWVTLTFSLLAVYVNRNVPIERILFWHKQNSQ